MAVVNRFDVFLVNLDPSPEDAAKNTRPGVVVSPDEMNHNVDHVLIAPLATTNAKYPTRVAVEFLNSERSVILDQLRTVDKIRLVKKIGEIGEAAQGSILDRLSELFAK
ncbi:MAG TPA: type II toxin-antitoxin system PemK/MazF family toxin [Pyrinomonadaceae bacterium]|nr:type II toxin-antitoxin system PemK/MazF family toxin [Pyrinomonadaceae bacterium]